jgi:3-hydroxyisobutyrate dehydrogenase
MLTAQQAPLRAGYIGLGAMGAPMAGHLARAGHLHAVYNRTPEKAAAFAQEFGVAAMATPQALAAAVDVIFLNVSADSDVLELVAAMQPALRAGQILVDNSTVSPASAQTLASALAPLQVAFLDAPVSGGVEGAKNGKLSLMIGGDADVLARVQPMLACFSARMTHLGGVGTGQACKAVNQVIVAGIAQGVCEALAMAEKLELPQDKLLAVLTGGAANSWFLEKRGASMLNDEFQSGFKLGLLLKDLNIVAALGKSLGLQQTVVAQSIADYTALVANGRGDEEISALIRRKRGA